MNIKKQWVKPIMVTEQFSADQYVAICAESSQYLYGDFLAKGEIFYYNGQDHHFQDQHAISGFAWIIEIILRIFTNRTLQSNGEFTGVQTIDNPLAKGTLVESFDFPIYGSSTLLNDGDEYSGSDLRPKLKKIPENMPGEGKIYIQGNMS